MPGIEQSLGHQPFFNGLGRKRFKICNADFILQLHHAGFIAQGHRNQIFLNGHRTVVIESFEFILHLANQILHQHSPQAKKAREKKACGGSALNQEFNQLFVFFERRVDQLNKRTIVLLPIAFREILNND